MSNQDETTFLNSYGIFAGTDNKDRYNVFLLFLCVNNPNDGQKKTLSIVKANHYGASWGLVESVESFF